jgi:RimJ/RimL family protein N-acetyltransferase
LIIDPDNLASQRVAQGAGFEREGVLRSHVIHLDGRRRDSVMFSLLPGELVLPPSGN